MKAKILIVEDDGTIAIRLRRFLNNCGYEAFAVGSGENALEMADNVRPALALMDINLGNDAMDGIATARTLRMQFDIPSIFMTAFADDTVLERARHTEPYGYLVKPLQDLEIRATLEMALSKLDADKKLRENALRYQTLFENSPISLWEKDFSQIKQRIDELRQSGINDFRAYFKKYPEELPLYKKMIRIISLNNTSLKLYHAESKEQLIENFDKIIAEESADTFREKIIALAEGRTEFETETINCKLNGDKIHISLKLSVVAGYEETLSKILISIMDITERKHAEEERKKLESRLRQAQSMEAIGTLAGGIAHDFNNILFPIIGYTEMTCDGLPRKSVAYQNLQEVLKASDRAKELVNQILTFSRQSEQEKVTLKIQPIVKEALKMLRSTIPATINIVQNIDPNCSSVLGDPTQIYQIIMNLCTNAYHAMTDSGGLLEVTLAEVIVRKDDSDMIPGSYLKLSVSDTGIGMPKEIQERIFDPFFTTKPVGRGTGLGLSVVHGIVIQMGGYIRVYSEPGKGTVVIVYLPAITSEHSDIRTSPDSGEPIPTGTEHILLVDDEEPILSMLGRMLEELGYRITPRTSSVEAFKAFQNKPGSFDLVITDMTMPNMTGAQLSGKLMAIRPDIPIILCTGFSEHINGKKAEAMGIRGYLMKPVVRADMAKMIRKVMEEIDRSSER